MTGLWRTLRLSARFLRPRAGFAWLAPALIVGLVLTFSFVVLNRSDRSAADRVQWDFGGGDTAVYLNGAVSTTAADFPLDAIMAGIDEIAGAPFCARLDALISSERNDGSVLAYSEFRPPCSPGALGYELIGGRWPASPGEIAVDGFSGR